jgi:transposase
VAISLAAELGELKRFAHPRDLMGYLGLVPSEHSSGQKRSLGSIAKTGNGYACRMLIEAAWNYHFAARTSLPLQKRQEGQPAPIREAAWKARLRLTYRYRRLTARGLQHNKVCVAIARELSGLSGASASRAPSALDHRNLTCQEQETTHDVIGTTPDRQRDALDR